MISRRGFIPSHLRGGGVVKILLIVIPNLFRNLLNFTSSPLVGEGWGEGESTRVFKITTSLCISYFILCSACFYYTRFFKALRDEFKEKCKELFTSLHSLVPHSKLFFHKIYILYEYSKLPSKFSTIYIKT